MFKLVIFRKIFDPDLRFFLKPVRPRDIIESLKIKPVSLTGFPDESHVMLY